MASLCDVCRHHGCATVLYKKTDKSKPMGANVALANAIGGQPTERGASAG